jgi:hypothetical protein
MELEHLIDPSGPERNSLAEIPGPAQPSAQRLLIELSDRQRRPDIVDHPDDIIEIAPHAWHARLSRASENVERGTGRRPEVEIEGDESNRLRPIKVLGELGCRPTDIAEDQLGAAKANAQSRLVHLEIAGIPEEWCVSVVGGRW